MESQITKLQFENESYISTSPFPLQDFYPIPPLSPTSISSARKLLNPSSSSFDSSMAEIVIVLLPALFIVGFFSLYIRQISKEATNFSRRQRQISSSSSLIAASNQGLDPLIIQSLPFISYEGNTKEAIDCSVCLCEFVEREKLKMIPFCKHLFHQECIDMWLSSHGTCPLCRSTQLFLLPSVKKEICLDVLEDGFELDEEESRVQSEESSTVERESDVSPGRMRRISSCSSLGERVILKRSFSF